MGNYKALVEKRTKYKYTVLDVKHVIKLLCTSTEKKQNYPGIFESVEGRISIRQIKNINYILRYGDMKRINMLLVCDYQNPYKIRYMIGRIKNIVKKFDRDEKHETYQSILENLKKEI